MNYHFDTIDSVFQGNNTFNPSFRLTESIRPKTISLNTAEIPISISNVRESNYTNSLLIISGGLVASIIIPENNYSSITYLLNQINKQINDTGIFDDDKLPFFSTNNGRVIITTKNSHGGLGIGWDNSLVPTSNLVTTVLGFNENTNITGLNLTINQSTTGNTMTAFSCYNLFYDLYLNLFFVGLPTRSTSSSNKLMSFKLPFNVTNGSIFYNAEGTSFRQYLEITDPHFVLSQLQLQVYDRFGCPLNNGGQHWCFSLLITH